MATTHTVPRSGATGAALVLGSDALRAEQVADFARRPDHWEIRLDADAEARMTAAQRVKDDLVASGQPVYGVTTGFGDSCGRHIGPAKAAALQRNLISGHLAGSGGTAPPEVARATMLIRANCLARGYSGVRVALVELLTDCLREDILPLIPERGSVGASGDLVPLAYLADMLTGNGAVVHRGEKRPAAAALRRAGLTPMELAPKEGLALINGTSFMSGYAVAAVRAARDLAAIADLCTALAVEALQASSGPFEPFLHTQKPHPGQRTSAARIHRLLEGSKLAIEHRDRVGANPRLAGEGYQMLRTGLQDRYSVRCAPHVTGVLNDTLDWVADWLDIEINSTNDNPLFDPEAGEVHHGGNFYGGHVGQAMDALKLAVASVGDLLDRQMAMVVDEKSNQGLTANLVRPTDDTDYDSGMHHGFKAAQIASSSLAAEALKNTAPATAFSRSTESHNQDKVSMASIAARDALQTVELVQNIAAIDLAALCQAVDLRGADRMAPATRAAHERVRSVVRFVDRDRRLDTDLAELVALIRSGGITAVLPGPGPETAAELPGQPRRSCVH
ncbi:aromatic amino acid ammonia-lyase [Streptomyces sp. I05A-00742]|uniref:aromatic amino acid ammonia-lyase n=1 Tax=Streptomyces sp. I05A-00742 TaxID=2732853 RepID=UPI0020181E4E|nr:aromatic amino acid ammonia-lyase [Streptomyces sp. I05A-00742]